MTRSVSRQDKPNLALWLATRAGKMELSCPLGIRAMSRKENLSCFGVLSHIINPLLTKLVRTRWLDIGLVHFLRVHEHVLFLRVHKHAKNRTSFLRVNKHAKKKRHEANIQKKNEANMKPSWPHAWSITHIYFVTLKLKWRLHFDFQLKHLK